MSTYDDFIVREQPVSYLPLSDPSGTTAVALVGSDGTYVNSPTLGVDGPFATMGDGITTDGTNDHVINGSTLNMASGAWSVEVWAAWTGTTFQRICGVIDGGMHVRLASSCDAGGFANDAGRIAALRRTGSVSMGRETAGNSYNDGGWHHVIAVWTGTGATADIYVDGVLDNGTTSAYAGVSQSSIARPLHWGAENNNGTVDAFFAGSLAASAVYDRALTASEIQAHFDAGSSLWFGAHSPMVMG